MIKCRLENGDEIGLRHTVVAAIILKEGKILLEKRGSYQGKPLLESGKWALPGGFFDRDETLIEAIKRECIEELGLEILNVKLFAIVDNPKRPKDTGRQNVNMVFTAEPGKYDKIDSEEVTEVEWFDLDKIPEKSQMAFDFWETIDIFKKSVASKTELPVMISSLS